jgi:hypothetical protein
MSSGGSTHTVQYCIEEYTDQERAKPGAVGEASAFAREEDALTGESHRALGAGRVRRRQT